MSLKAKLATTIAALCMVICLLSVGVWAASQGTLTLNGTVGFQANDVNVTITGDATSTQGFDLPTGEELNVSWDATNDTAEATWAPALTFKSKTDVITVTITVGNKSTDRYVTAAFSPKLGGVDIPVMGEGEAFETHAIELGNTNIKAMVVETYTTIEKATVTPGSEGAEDTVTPTSKSFVIKMAIVDGNDSVAAAPLKGTLLLTDQYHGN